MTNPNRVLILFSDTGGGHRASGEAIQEALKLEFGDRVESEMIDVIAGYTPYPFSRLPRWYPHMVSERTKWLWGRGYRLSNGARRSRAIATTVYPYVRPSIRRMLRSHPADVFVIVHALIIVPVLRAMGVTRPPVLTVVTDLVSVHSWWFHQAIDYTIVPTETARQFAVQGNGIHPARIKTVGLPISQKFSAPRGDKVTLRIGLGWDPTLPTVLMMSGGDGIGPMGETAKALANMGLPLQLAVICGRNDKLKRQLTNYDWPVPAHIYGFVTNMPELMQAADILVTKAGPSSVVEGLNCGLPLILSGAIPGQEDGNVSWIVENNAGIWAPTPKEVVKNIRELLTGDPQRLHTMTTNAHALARPTAARDIAREIGRFFFSRDAPTYQPDPAPEENPSA